MSSSVSRSHWTDSVGGKSFVSGVQCARSAHSHSVHGFSSTWLLQHRKFSTVLLLTCRCQQHSAPGSQHLAPARSLWWFYTRVSLVRHPCTAFHGRAHFQQVLENRFPESSASVVSQQFLCHSMSHGHALSNEIWMSARGWRAQSDFDNCMRYMRMPLFLGNKYYNI